VFWLMQLRLHANATTTPRTRAYIQQSTASRAALAREVGIHPRTVASANGERGRPRNLLPAQTD
jgi:hypothetical protein